MKKPEFCSRKVYNLAKTCWNKDPNKRPTFESLHDFFGTDAHGGKKGFIEKLWDYIYS